MLQKITPDSKEHWLSMRIDNINSTEVSALFNLSPYMTEFELWHNKKNKTSLSLDPNERMEWGNRLEAAIAEGVLADNNWEGMPLKDYWVNEETKTASSFDWEILEHGKKGLLEVKNVDGLVFYNQWEETENGVEAPAHIEMQLQHQLLVSGYDFGYIAALVGGNRMILLKRERNEAIINSMKLKIADFWNSINDNAAPSADFARDADFITSLYQRANPETIMDIDGEGDVYQLAKKYKEVSEEIKALEVEKKACKAQILMNIDKFEKVKHPLFSISAGMTKESTVQSFVKKPFRNFRIFWKKVK